MRCNECVKIKTHAIEIVAGVLAVEVASTVLNVAGVGKLSNVQLGEESEHLRLEFNQTWHRNETFPLRHCFQTPPLPCCNTTSSNCTKYADAAGLYREPNL
jgi:hypothetical protein